MGFFKEEYRKQNDKCAAFLLAVNSLSHKLLAYPTPNKNAKSWRRALETLTLEHADEVSLFISDNDTAIKEDLRKYLYDKYQISWSYSFHRSKSYLAEVYMRSVGLWVRHACFF